MEDLNIQCGLPDLNAGPRVVLFLKHGDICIVDDQKMVFKEGVGDLKELVYLTTLDSDTKAWTEECQRHKQGLLESDNLRYSTFIRHVRDSNNYALMTRQELAALIISGRYSID